MTKRIKKERLKKLYDYLCGNREVLLPYNQKNIDIPKPSKGVIYRNLGTMEHHIYDIIAQRMKIGQQVGALKAEKILLRY